MEALKQPISVRVSRIISDLAGRTERDEKGSNLFTREGLLDAVTVLYDECNTESIKKFDKNIQKFVETYRKDVSEIKRQRVNITDFEVKNVIGRGEILKDTFPKITYNP